MQGFVRQFTIMQDEVRGMQAYMSAAEQAQDPDDGEPEPEVMGLEDAPDQVARQSAHAQDQSALAQEQYERDLAEWETQMQRDGWRRRRNRERSSRSDSRRGDRSRSRHRRRRRGNSDSRH